MNTQRISMIGFGGGSLSHFSVAVHPVVWKSGCRRFPVTTHIARDFCGQYMTFLRRKSAFCDTVDWSTGPGLLSVVTNGADNVTLDCAGRTIRTRYQNTGILVEGRSGVTVRNCTIDGEPDAGIGIKVLSSSYVVLEGNSIMSGLHHHPLRHPLEGYCLKLWMTVD